VSAGRLTITVAPRFRRTDAGGKPASPLILRLIRVGSFAALGLYGVVRWATLLSPAPMGRLLGLLGLAFALVAFVPLLRRIGPPPAAAGACLLCLLALPVAGLNWHDFLHLRIAVSAQAIGHGLSGLPGSFVPYVGTSPAIRLVILLGAAVLLLDGAVVLAFAPRGLGELRRAGAALPLIALAIVPSTLLRPEFPYLQGLVLFVLLVAFVWGERAQAEGKSAAIAMLAVAGLAGAVLAPRLDGHRALLNYRAWTGSLVRPHLDVFAWNQRYGPLHWPRAGHVVLTVQAAHADYWKAEDLDVFNGYGWAAGPVSAAALPAPAPSARARWSQPIRVSVSGMRSSEVIGSGYSAAPSSLPGVAPGPGAGTWVSYRPLAPGDTYTVSTYSPHPSPFQLQHAGTRYPTAALNPYLTLTVPVGPRLAGGTSTVEFPLFGSEHGVATQGSTIIAKTVDSAVYGPVYALARRLAARASSPYAYVMAVERFLGNGYTYNESPPARPYPLVSFLFRDKIGYCQQFSGAMALLLRMGGVPARVAAGFTSGSESAHHRWVVTDIDAHAWVEAWFPRYGWVRFDPTPGNAPARGGNTLFPIVKSLPGQSSAAGAAPRRQAQAAPVSTRGAHGPSGGGDGLWLLVPGVAVVILVGLLAVSALAPDPTPEQRLRELERALARTGRPLGPEVTLAALERRFRDSAGAAAYVRALRLGRYAGVQDAPGQHGGRRAVREQLRQGLGATGRLRALWALPPRPGSWRRRRDQRRGRRSGRLLGH
jgi:protein-glutamine gamma-glutamyltransferase